MAILTKPQTINKGIPANFEINKANLSGLSVIANDPYFNNIQNWKSISIVYKNEFGNSETVSFDATQLSPTGKFSVSDKTRGDFQVEAILIYDFDGDYLLIPKVEVQNVPDFQVTFVSSLSPFISAWRNLAMVYSMSASYTVD